MRRRLLHQIAAPVTVVAAMAAVPLVATAQSASGPLVVQVAHSDTYGDYLVDGDGIALYVAVQPDSVDQVNKAGSPPVAACTGACLQVWPPAETEGAPKAGDGVKADMLSTVTDPNGGTQVSYAGWPLYYFAADTSKGDVFGQAVVPPQGAALGAAWYLLAPDGSVILTQPPAE